MAHQPEPAFGGKGADASTRDAQLDERTIRDRLRREGLDANAWSNGPGDRYSRHDHPYDKALVCVAGSITFHVSGSTGDVPLGPGDRLDLPAGTGHAATVGPDGVTCLEAHLAAGAIGPLALRRDGTW